MDMYETTSKPYQIPRTLEQSRQIIHQLLCNRATDVDDLTYTADAVFEHISLFGHKSIDLSAIPINANGEHISLMLRCLSTWKNDFKNWDEVIELAKRNLTQEKVDFKDALYGII